MKFRIGHLMGLALIALFITGICFVDADAQQQRRRRRPSRRVTNPAVRTPAPQPTQTTAAVAPDAKIISTADEQSRDQTGDAEIGSQTSSGRRLTNRSRAVDADDPETMRHTINVLSSQVTKLTDKITSMEEQQRTLVDLERLSRAEQRGENLRAQLRDVYAKEADLQARAEQIEYDLRPENLERSVATFGTTRPEEVREQRRRQLESEKTRVRSQLDLMTTSRTRLDAAIASADAEAERLRQRIDASASDLPKPETGNNKNNAETTSATTTPPPPTSTNAPPPPPQ